MKKNRLDRVSLSGGLIGALTTNPRRAAEEAIERANADGWHCVQILPHKTNNLLIFLLQVLVLLLTLGLWTWGAGYLLLFEKEA